MINPQHNIQIDSRQAISHLLLLGYQRDEKVFNRAFGKNSGMAFKEEQLVFNVAGTRNAQGLGIHIVVNGGGHSNDENKTGRAIFYEHDRVNDAGKEWMLDCFPDAQFQLDQEHSKEGKNSWLVPKTVQRDLWVALDLPEPTFQVDSGNKSIHSYWVLENPIDIGEWKKLQSDLLEFADADRQLNKPAQMMRLAGYVNEKSGNLAEIISQSGKTYSYDELRGNIPFMRVANSQQKTFQRNDNLSELLEKEIYPRLDAAEFYITPLKASGRFFRGRCPIHGGKNPTSFVVNPTELTFYCHSCGANGGPVQFLHQLNGGSGSPTGKDFVEIVRSLCSDVGVEFPEKKFESDRKVEKTRDRDREVTEKVVKHPAWQPMGYEELVAELKNLATETSEATIAYRLAQLGKSSGIGEKTVTKIFHKLEEERERQERNLEKEIKEILKASSHRLNIEEILPGNLAKPINLLASRMALRPEAYMMALLCQANSLLKAGTTLELLPATNWKTRPNLQVALVAEASVGKTPIAHAIIDEPMEPLRQAAWAAYEQAEQDYQEAIAVWNRLSKEEQKENPQPKKPEPRIFHFSPTSTMEGMLKHLAKFPDSGHMVYADELKAFFDGQGQYKGGNGTDKSTLLSCWSGKNPNGQMRAADGGTQSFYFPKPINLGIYGGIQPAVFSRLMGGSDPQGEFARFLYVEQPFTVANFVNLVGAGRIDLRSVLTRIYERIEAMPMREFLLSHEALEYLALFHDKCGEKAKNEIRQALRAVLGKLPDQAGRLAIALHVISSSAENDEISLETLKAAIKVAKFCYSQIENLLRESEGEIVEELPANLAKILKFVERRGSATLNEIRRAAFSSTNRPQKSELKIFMDELINLNFLQTVDGKNFLPLLPLLPPTTLKTLPSDDLNSPPFRHSAATFSTAENISEIIEDEKVAEVAEKVATSKPDTESDRGEKWKKVAEVAEEILNFPQVGDLIFRKPCKKYPGLEALVIREDIGGFWVATDLGEFYCSRFAWEKKMFIPVP
jgi:Protein of unknown function (DUF3987)/CHC2 zinc finger